MSASRVPLHAAALAALLSGCTCYAPVPGAGPKPTYGHLTVESGRTYKILNVGWVAQGKVPHFAIELLRDDSTPSEALTDLRQFGRLMVVARVGQLPEKSPPEGGGRLRSGIVLTSHQLSVGGMLTSTRSTTYAPWADGTWETLGKRENLPMVGPGALRLLEAWSRNAEAEAEAVLAGSQWLAMLDTQPPSASRNAADPLFQADVDLAAWTGHLEERTRNLGAVLGRTQHAVLSLRNHGTLPQGLYITLFANTVSEKRGHVVETTTLQRRTQGGSPQGWAVVRYERLHPTTEVPQQSIAPAPTGPVQAEP